MGKVLAEPEFGSPVPTENIGVAVHTSNASAGGGREGRDRWVPRTS